MMEAVAPMVTPIDVNLPSTEFNVLFNASNSRYAVLLNLRKPPSPELNPDMNRVASA
jgi:hypothetical protein